MGESDCTFLSPQFQRSVGFVFGPKVTLLDEDAPYLRPPAEFKAWKLSELEFAVANVKVQARPSILRS